MSDSIRKYVLTATTIVLLALVLLGFRAWQARRSATIAAQLETAQVTRGDIEATVSASGNLTPNRRINLTFLVAGRVQSIFVSEGELVGEGQVLATLDKRELELGVRQAEAALAIAEANLAQAKAGATEEELASARAALASAQASLDELRNTPDARQLELAKLNWEQAKNSLWAAQIDRDGLGPVGGHQYDAANARVAVAEVAVRIAQLQYEQTAAGPREAQIKAAEAQLAQAKAALAKLENNPTTESLAILQAQVDQARASLELARLRLEGATITAPFTGTVGAIHIAEGELVSSTTPAIILADLSGYHIDIAIDETDIRHVAVGQEARVSLDAFPGASFVGMVTAVAPIGTISQGVVNYMVRVELVNPAEPVRPDMTAIVDIIVARKQGVLLVPNRAIRRDRDRQYVEVVIGQSIEERDVTTGLSDDKMTEVVSGVREGDWVVTSVPRAGLFSSEIRLFGQ
ncbi:MAG: efflux RND transporter periplasmic adaptor subunit [Chloroflexi bacterium]|nr:efflux RND transporter periplasmic adaptor subunit [Chloroflexota bacterium]